MNPMPVIKFPEIIQTFISPKFEQLSICSCHTVTSLKLNKVKQHSKKFYCKVQTQQQQKQAWYI